MCLRNSHIPGLICTRACMCGVMVLQAEAQERSTCPSQLPSQLAAAMVFAIRTGRRRGRR